MNNKIAPGDMIRFRSRNREFYWKVDVRNNHVAGLWHDNNHNPITDSDDSFAIIVSNVGCYDLIVFYVITPYSINWIRGAKTDTILETISSDSETR